MTQVSRGNRPGVALPIRIHDLLLGLAGRLDDDALADARQMLASAELDRSLEFVAGCLVAGRVVLSKTQHRELESLFADTYLDPSVIDRVAVRDPAPAARHRFAVGAVEGREPDRGVADAVRPVLDVLPDVRSVWCVWRLTPAGPVSGPVPHRVVLVGVGPGGFAPATAYRVEYALRRAGIRASVEVLVDGNQPTDYHQEAMRCARQVPFAEPDSGNRPRMSPVEPARAESFESPRVAAPAQPFGGERYDQPAEQAAEPQRPLPPPVELPARTEILPAVEPPAERRLPPPVGLPHASAAESASELAAPIELHRGEAADAPTPPQGGMLPPPIELHRQAPGPRIVSPDTAPGESSGPLPPPIELRRSDGPPVAGPQAARSAFAQERLPDEEPEDLPPSALSMDTPTNSRPSPRRRREAEGRPAVPAAAGPGEPGRPLRGVRRRHPQHPGAQPAAGAAGRAGAARAAGRGQHVLERVVGPARQARLRPGTRARRTGDDQRRAAQPGGAWLPAGHLTGGDLVGDGPQQALDVQAAADVARVRGGVVAHHADEVAQQRRVARRRVTGRVELAVAVRAEHGEVGDRRVGRGVHGERGGARRAAGVAEQDVPDVARRRRSAR